jgi:hypothetical protein
MKKALFLFLILFPLMLTAQITRTGYQQYKWGSQHSKLKTLLNCNSKLSGDNFLNCELGTKDSLLLNKFKYQFANARFYKDRLAEIQFDIRHKDLAALISYLTEEHGSPIIKEKRHEALDKENQSTGYLWTIGDTQVFIINDGYKVPAICILSSISVRATYPPNTLSLEKLIFE